MEVSLLLTKLEHSRNRRVKPAKGKTTALWTLVLGILVLTALGIGSRDRVLVELYARALKSGSVEEKLRAARELGKMKSVKAVPVLLEALKQAMAPNRGSISDSLRRAIRGALLSIGEPAMLCLMRGLKDEDWRLLLPDADETLGQFFLQPVPKNVNGESAIVVESFLAEPMTDPQARTLFFLSQIVGMEAATGLTYGQARTKIRSLVAIRGLKSA